VLQFLHTFNRVKRRANDTLKWGDEVRCVVRSRNPVGREWNAPTAIIPAGWCAQIEYHLVRLDAATHTATVALVGPEVLAQLAGEDERREL
jgi:hypothetical protein